MFLLFAGANIVCLRMWGNRSSPFMQALHFSFALGAFIAPLLAGPFISNPVQSGKSLALYNNGVLSEPLSDPSAIEPDLNLRHKRIVAEFEDKLTGLELNDVLARSRRNTIPEVLSRVEDKMVDWRSRQILMDAGNSRLKRNADEGKGRFHAQEEDGVLLKSRKKSHFHSRIMLGIDDYYSDSEGFDWNDVKDLVEIQNEEITEGPWDVLSTAMTTDMIWETATDTDTFEDITTVMADSAEQEIVLANTQKTSNVVDGSEKNTQVMGSTTKPTTVLRGSTKPKVGMSSTAKPQIEIISTKDTKLGMGSTVKTATLMSGSTNPTSVMSGSVKPATGMSDTKKSTEKMTNSGSTTTISNPLSQDTEVKSTDKPTEGPLQDETTTASPDYMFYTTWYDEILTTYIPWLSGEYNDYESDVDSWGWGDILDDDETTPDTTNDDSNGRLDASEYDYSSWINNFDNFDMTTQDTTYDDSNGGLDASEYDYSSWINNFDNFDVTTPDTTYDESEYDESSWINNSDETTALTAVTTPSKSDSSSVTKSKSDKSSDSSKSKGDDATGGDHPIKSHFQGVYVIIGVFLMLMALVFAYLTCTSPLEVNPIGKYNQGEINAKPSGNNFTQYILILLCVFYFLYVGAEVGYGGFIYTFAVHHPTLSFTASEATHLNALFWGAFAMGRGMSICIASYLSPLNMLIIDLIGCLLSSFALAIQADTSSSILWCATAILGLSMASLFPAGISWLESHAPVTGNMTSLLIVGAAFGEMAIPLLLGKLFILESVGPMSLMYVMCVISTLTAAIFGTTVFLAGKQGLDYNPLPKEDTLEDIITGVQSAIDPDDLPNKPKQKGKSILPKALQVKKHKI